MSKNQFTLVSRNSNSLHDTQTNKHIKAAESKGAPKSNFTTNTNYILDMQFFALAITAFAALAMAEDQNKKPQCQPTVTKYVYMTNKPVKNHHRPCPPVNCDVCPYTDGDFFVLKDKVPFYKAECACREKGGILAEVNSANWNNATNVNFKCIGANAHAWIKSWNTDNYNHACLALYTGNQNGGGAISVPVSCDNHVPVLCQKVHKQCDKPDSCYEYVWEWTETESGDCPCRPHDRGCHEWWNSCETCKPHRHGHHHNGHHDNSNSDSSNDRHHGRGGRGPRNQKVLQKRVL